MCCVNNSLDAVMPLRQVLLSCNILGNPVGVFNSLGTGVRDFFRSPIEGAVVSPADFALGLGTPLHC